MQKRTTIAVGLLTLALGASGCRRDATVEQRDRTATTPEAARKVDRAAEVQRQREQDLAKLDERVASLERDYQEKRAASPSGTSGATAGLRSEVKSDMDDVPKAVANLRSTTPENWWERHEAALKMAFDDVESDVKRFAGAQALPVSPKNPNVSDASGEPVSTVPFTSRRDKFVADMRIRVDAMNKALDDVKASGARKTELDDLHARVNKLGDDIDRLKSASADDWWDISKTRLSEYIDRMEKSVGRLDDNKR
jgi:cytochrome c556